MAINVAHLEQVRQEDFRPNLPNLEQISRLEQMGQAQQMTPAEYREAWAWVHLMLRSRPEAKAVLLKYLQQLRTTATPGPLRPRLAEVFPSPEEALEKHLAQIGQEPGGRSQGAGVRSQESGARGQESGVRSQ
jgi:hypothetical protein